MDNSSFRLLLAEILRQRDWLDRALRDIAERPARQPKLNPVPGLPAGSRAGWFPPNLVDRLLARPRFCPRYGIGRVEELRRAAEQEAPRDGAHPVLHSLLDNMVAAHEALVADARVAADEGRPSFSAAVFAEHCRAVSAAVGYCESLPERSTDDAVPSREHYLPAKKAQAMFGFGNLPELTRFLKRHPNIRTRQPTTRSGDPHRRRRMVHVLDLAQAVSRDDAIMSDPVRRGRMEARLKKANLTREAEESALAYLGQR